MTIYVYAVIILLAGLLLLVFRKRAKAKLRLGEYSYRALVENIPQRIFLKSTDFKFISVNEAFAEELHLRPADIVGKVDYDLYPKELADKYRADDQRIIEHGKTEEFEEQHQAGCETLWVNTTKVPVRNHAGEITGILGIFWDITEHRKLEQRANSLQKLNEEKATLLQSILNSPEGVLIYALDRDYRYLAFTRSHQLAAQKEWGCEIKVGMNIMEVITNPETRAKAKVGFDRALQGERFSEELDCSGNPFHRGFYEDRYSPIYDLSGAVCGLTIFTTDISERKKAEQKIEVTNQQLTKALDELHEAQLQIIQQEKLRGLGQMASGLAHDFNNALSPIIGFSELLLKHPEKRTDPVQVVKWLQNIHTCATEAANVVRRMREFGRQQIGTDKLTSLDLNRLVLQTLEFTEPSWKAQVQSGGRTIHMATDLTPVPLVPGEESGIRELLMNVLFNAVEAMPTGGTITLSTDLEEGFVRVRISDTGAGMTEEVRQHCLDPFFTTKKEGGKGLGLPMAHSIAKRHGGMLTVESALGQGTTVTIRLPVHDGAPAKIFITETATSSRALRILLVDDQPELCEVVTEYLTTDGHTVTSAENGAVALTQFRSGQFDLVITDRAMPEMNGEQLAAAIHQIKPNFPVILMTGFGDLMKANGEMPPFIRLILSKPVSQISLRDALTKALEPEAH